MSFGDTSPLEEFNEKLSQLRDLDNLIFAEDVLVVISASNSPLGLQPNPRYPNSHEDPKWRTPAWARGFNSLVCGSFVGELRPNGLTTVKGLPSPFSRVGPGISGAPVPNFAEHGGDTDASYTKGYGVAVCDSLGRWRETCGTSYTAPLLARKAAHIFKDLEKYCTGTTRPYACLVKAFMAMSARVPIASTQKGIKELATKTLGRGLVDLNVLRSPSDLSAIFFWQFKASALTTVPSILRISNSAGISVISFVLSSTLRWARTRPRLVAKALRT
jgi:hypothetical protein